MQTLMSIIFFASLIALILTGSINVKRSNLSRYELLRRKKLGDTSATDELKRESNLSDVLSIINITESIFFVISVISSAYLFDLFAGLLVGVVIAVTYRRISQLKPIRDFTNHKYRKYERRLIDFVVAHPSIKIITRNVSLPLHQVSASSQDELVHIIENSSKYIDEAKLKMLTSSLVSYDKDIKRIMTSIEDVYLVEQDSLVGPLLLSELHKTGHRVFPVSTEKNNPNTIVGTIDIDGALTLKDKISHKASQIMDKEVAYIHAGQNIKDALHIFVNSRQKILFVIDSENIVGILTLNDAMECIYGKRLVLHDDEFYNKSKVIKKYTKSI